MNVLFPPIFGPVMMHIFWSPAISRLLGTNFPSPSTSSRSGWRSPISCSPGRKTCASSVSFCAACAIAAGDRTVEGEVAVVDSCGAKVGRTQSRYSATCASAHRQSSSPVVVSQDSRVSPKYPCIAFLVAKTTATHQAAQLTTHKSCSPILSPMSRKMLA
jgi:hypothetical protein